MNISEFMKDIEHRMVKTVEETRREIAGIRTGRASTTLVEMIEVDAYGTKTPLRQMANVSVPDARSIVIQPWDKSIVKNVEKAILASDLGITPQHDGNVIRLNMPPLTEERRKDLVKQVKHLAENGKVALRNLRRHANDDLKKAEKDGHVPEDQVKKNLDSVQKMVDEHTRDIDKVISEKTDEILHF